jgi:hypothetical protein
MPQISRIRFVSIGHVRARFKDLTLDLRDETGRATSTTLWLRNGGGKSSALNLFFALVRPSRHEFLGSKAEAKKRLLDNYILQNDHSVVACEWQLDDPSKGEDPQGHRVTGVFYEWKTSTERDDTFLKRLFFSCRADPNTPLAIDRLPLFGITGDGRTKRIPLGQYKQSLAELRTKHPHLEIFQTESQHEWNEHLNDVGIDPELFTYQLRMNQREGAVDEIFRFAEPEQFIDFLIELALDRTLGEKIGTNITTYRNQLKERIQTLLPDRDLSSGLVSRLSPLMELRTRRADLQEKKQRTAHSLRVLRGHINQRIVHYEQEAAAHATNRDNEHRQAVIAKEDASAQTQIGAACRLIAAECKHTEALEKTNRIRSELEEASKQLLLWEAAIPLRNARRFERQAQDYRAELERKEKEHAPVLFELQNAANRLSGALTFEKTALRQNAETQRTASDAARKQAHEARENVTKHEVQAAGAKGEIKRIQELLRSCADAQSRLIAKGILLADELPPNGRLRLNDEILKLETRIAELQESETAIQAKLLQIQTTKEQLTADHANAQSTVNILQAEIERAQAVRHALEENPLLKRQLELETVDLERIPDNVQQKLREAERKMLYEIVQSEVQKAEDMRAVLGIEQTGLLPPSADASKVIQRLKSSLPIAWTGWEYIEVTLSSLEERKNIVERHPELAMGAIVRDVDFDKAKKILADQTPNLESPITVAPASAFIKPDTTINRIVIGPMSRARYSRPDAAVELVKRSDRVKSSDRHTQQQEATRQQLEALIVKFGEFRAGHPIGWFAAQQDKFQTRRSEVARLAAQTRNVIAEINEEAEALAKNHAVREQLRSKLNGTRLHVELVEEFIRQHSSQTESRNHALGQAHNELAAAELSTAQYQDLARAADASAAHASKLASDLGEEARAREEELRQIRYAQNPTYEGPAQLDELRDRYAQLKTTYEEKVGQDGMLQLCRTSEAQAAEERLKFQKKIQAPLRESDVLLALHSLKGSVEAESKRDEVATTKLALTGALGNQTGVVNRAAEELEEAKKRCAQAGTIELPTQSKPLNQASAEMAAKTAEEQARLASQKAKEHENQEAKAERLHQASEQSVAALQRDCELLDTIARNHGEPVAQVLPDTSWVSPTTDAEITPTMRKLDRELNEIKSLNLKLDQARSNHVKAIRQWVSSPRFESLPNSLAKHFASLEEADLEAGASMWQTELNTRVQTIDQQLEGADRHRSLLITQTLGAADEALDLVNLASNQSRLPEDLKGLGGAQFLKITHNSPVDPADRHTRIGELIDELALNETPTGVTIVQKAVRRLVKGLRVKVLNPAPNVGTSVVDITDLTKFSGGEQLTTAILLYCTLAKIRARSRGTQFGRTTVLILDNPIGRASRARFLELQREVARAMNVQLIYTTAVNDLEALQALPNIIRLRNTTFDRSTATQLVELEQSPGQIEAVRIARTQALQNKTQE